MHNFDGIETEQGKYPVGFHQTLNGKIINAFGDDLPINDAIKWNNYRRDNPGAIERMGRLIVESYGHVFRRFRAKDEAANKFVSEVNRELTILLSRQGGTP
jgi:hypothetical protein